MLLLYNCNMLLQSRSNNELSHQMQSKWTRRTRTCQVDKTSPYGTNPPHLRQPKGTATFLIEICIEWHYFQGKKSARWLRKAKMQSFSQVCTTYHQNTSKSHYESDLPLPLPFPNQNYIEWIHGQSKTSVRWSRKDKLKISQKRPNDQNSPSPHWPPHPTPISKALNPNNTLGTYNDQC